MPPKGTVKTGEVFCMSCGAAVDAAATRCESCYSELDSEVRAFRCPRCGKVLELGVQECPKCSMKFKVKTVRPSDTNEDEKILSRLIDWGRAPKPEPVPPAEPTPAPSGLTAEESESISALVRQLAELADLRAEAASSMGTGLAEARERISRMSGADASSLPMDDLEQELRTASQDIIRVDELVSRARDVSGEVARTFSMPGPARMAEGREVSFNLPRPIGGAAEGALSEREEQVRKREEMVDRKIKAYALKKKELDAMEAAPRANAGVAPGAEAAVLKELAPRVRSIHELLSDEGACDDVEPCLSSLEGHVRGLVASRSELEQKVSQLEEGEEEVRRLLKVLDGLLGQLPPEAVERFSKTDEFRLYERVLDRLRI